MDSVSNPLPQYDSSKTVVSDIVEIAAPAALVWQILTDLTRYGEWNPYCFGCESTLEIGAPVNMRLNSYTTPGETYANVEYLCAFEPERLLSWELPDSPAMPYPARRDQVILSRSPQSCAYYSTDAFFGDNAFHVMFFCGGWIKRAFDDTARALKSRAESLFAASRLARLEDIEQIKQLKYLYCRGLDTCDTGLLARLFTADAKVDYRGGTYRFQEQGGARIVALLEAAFNAQMVGCHTVHHPVIEVTGPDRATGEWTLTDYALNLGSNTATVGAALYQDQYVKRDGQWLIHNSQYQRLYERVYTEQEVGLTAHLLGDIHARRLIGAGR